MNIIVYSIKRLKYEMEKNKLVLDNDLYDDVYAIISTSYPDSLDFLSEIKDNLLILNYDDIQTFNGKSFDENMAQDIKSFVDNITNSNSTIYVCCDAGESRSAAIAASIMRYLGQDEMKIWKDPHFHPNLFVYNILCNIFGFNISEEELNQLKQINNSSLSDTINSTR